MKQVPSLHIPHCLFAVALLISSSLTGLAVNIVFDYSYDDNGFFSTVGPQGDLRRQVLENAGNFFEMHFEDELAALPQVDPNGGGDWFALFSDPAVADTEISTGLSVAENTLHIVAGGRALGGNTLGQGGPGGFNARGYAQYENGPPTAATAAWFDTVAARGQTGALDDPATDFGPWGGSITFDTATPWFFDADLSTNDVPIDQFDFYSVAIHELAHVLGFSISESFNTYVNAGTFTGPEATALNGDDVTLNETGHLAEGLLSLVYNTDISQETAMDPNIAPGQRKVMTDLDMAVMADMGWTLASPSPIPEPSTTVLLLGVMLAGTCCRRRRTA